jgi:hypothetical protein
MRNSILALIVVLISITIGYGSRTEGIRGKNSARPAGNEFQTQTEWIKFTSPEGRFSILLQHEPKFETVNATDTSGITNYRYSDLESGYGFICEYFDVASTGAVQDFLDVTRDGIIRGAGATKVGEEKISLNSYPGRELQMSFKVNEGTEIAARTRIYLVNKRLYSLTFLHVKSMDALLASDLGKKFFSSFELKPGN